jgi:myo-inositol 2-dehydrogenase/D-chiro-inositol 1-dehydrogenase
MLPRVTGVGPDHLRLAGEPGGKPHLSRRRAPRFLGEVICDFTFQGIDAYIQDIVEGASRRRPHPFGSARAREQRRMVGFAVLGCGRIGRMHARNLAAHPRAELVAVYDVANAAAEEVGTALGARVASSVDEALACPRVRAVLVASSTDTHVDLLTRSVKAGKAVLCEKPIDLDIAKVDACWAEIGGLAPVVMVGFNRRFDPSFRALRDRVQAGEIGKVEQIVITSRDPGPPPVSYIKVSGGLFRDMTIHDLDMARYLAGDIVEVQAMGANLVDPSIRDAGDIDAAMVVMRAASGAMVHVNNSRRCAYGYDQRVEAFGERGMLQAGNRRATTVEAWGAEHTGAKDVVLNFFIERYAEAYVAEIDHFVDCVEKGAKPLAGFEEGREALRLADAALESLKTGRAVSLPVRLDKSTLDALKAATAGRPRR